MKVTIENKKGLEKDLKVFIDKKTKNGESPLVSINLIVLSVM